MDVSAFLDSLSALIRSLLLFPITTIAAVNGHAFGGAFTARSGHSLAPGAAIAGGVTWTLC